jgi:peptidoglycan L-alanyl-D-glutamate endopeptidase CwlK
MSKLAPLFRAAVELAVVECNAGGLDCFVYEAYRSQELQAIYYARGRTVVPPYKPVTNARSNLYSWHGYSLAVDVVSKAHGWDRPDDWWLAVATIFKRHGCKWGGDWRQRDLPHFQWGRCKPSPSDLAREILATKGLEAVWAAVGAV